ncbi:hypothetical protein N824_07950 [Pedobacter sp. V48]|nr:hypothetical protein N824_07950 [Pedobacter sp. V48]
MKMKIPLKHLEGILFVLSDIYIKKTIMVSLGSLITRYINTVDLLSFKLILNNDTRRDNRKGQERFYTSTISDDKIK